MHVMHSCAVAFVGEGEKFRGQQKDLRARARETPQKKGNREHGVQQPGGAPNGALA
jgi:hypothetical protein